MVPWAEVAIKSQQLHVGLFQRSHGAATLAQAPRTSALRPCAPWAGAAWNLQIEHAWELQAASVLVVNFNCHTARPLKRCGNVLDDEVLKLGPILTWG